MVVRSVGKQVNVRQRLLVSVGSADVGFANPTLKNTAKKRIVKSVGVDILTLADEGFKSAFQILEELGKAGIQKKRKRHISFNSEPRTSNEVKHSNLKKISQGQESSKDDKNLALNSRQDDHQNKGKKSEVDARIHEVENLALNSFKSELQNKGKILVRLEGEVLEITTSHRKKKLESIRNSFNNITNLKETLKLIKDRLETIELQSGI